jgi:hypothetical protein
MGKCVQPACSTAAQQLKPSLTMLLPAEKSRLARACHRALKTPQMWATKIPWLARSPG